ncbi:proton-conducting transporter transmembrane domain-containing protein [Lacipirellula limnantheis]|uniref:Probable inorganic carbon transporter subunit DabB n=1 Tax=Lacipirellula limnantheis TaxID=2528024 RepID=A0A517TUJ8_9BACT|nr:proton-conducting transporter membrane subunit [Lacipirellula limnantheis]QDT72041.1 NADH-quinone oxidoreductase subunit L [Lacipirellula limnantheis]
MSAEPVVKSMNEALPWMLTAPPLALLACGLLPAARANRRPRAAGLFGVGAAAATFVCGVAAATTLSSRGPIDVAFLRAAGVSFGVYFDSLTAVMLLLISFLGATVIQFSRRYLDGEAGQGRFTKWLSCTLGAVLLLVISRNLVMFTVAWICTSAGLHQLLTHYADRPAAMLAARKKFLISRCGDALLLLALGWTYHAYGTFEYTELFAAANAAAQDAAPDDWSLSIIATLFALGAMTKSAQFPLHTWLPETMETPTPVSAFMHAGIINAGGFLVIRLSPLISHSEFALGLLGIVGGVTAFFGAVVMITQSSVKRALAYSTISQMGFMMLQCGLGAFSAALLHIVAHSLYKSFAFLNSGSVVEEVARRSSAPLTRPTAWRTTANFVLAVAMAVGAVALGVWIAGVDDDRKPGALLLVLVLVAALTQLVWNALQTSRLKVAMTGAMAAIAVAVAYFVSYRVVDAILGASVSHRLAPSSIDANVLTAGLAAGFLGVCCVLAGRRRWAHTRLMRWLYVQVLNGFYLDLAAHRFTKAVLGRPTSPSNVGKE